MIKATTTIKRQQAILDVLESHLNSMSSKISEYEAVDPEPKYPNAPFNPLEGYGTAWHRGFEQCLKQEHSFLSGIFLAMNVMDKPLETKFFEVRDDATCMAAIGIKMSHRGRNEAEKFLLGNAGYGREGRPLILLNFISINESHYDWRRWGGRTRPVSHKFIYENFDSLESGSVVDVRFILGETKEPAKSDRFWTPDDD